VFVPAFAFAWWLASLQPTAEPPGLHPSAARATPDSDGDPPAFDDAALAGAAAALPTNARGDWSGVRVKPKVLTPAIVHAAQGFLDLPLGDERFLAIDGRRYVFVLQWHYHPPGFVGGPNGWHKGVTVFEIE